MLSQPSQSLIQPDHLDRDAVIYVRQSSLMQVRDNTTSTLRQYDLVQRALSLGWPRERIYVIDQDQAHSGSSSTGRDGFQSLVAEVALKHCGALLSRGASHAWRARAAIGITSWRFVPSPTRSSLTKTASMILATTMIDCCWACMLDIIWNAVEDEYLTVIMYLLCSIPMRFSGKTSQMIHN